MSWRRLYSLLVTATLVLTSSIGTPRTTHAANVVVVSPADMQGWSFMPEPGSGAGQMALGPGTPPRGLGSARLTVSSSSDGMVLGRQGWNGVRLDRITKLQYSTYRTSGAAFLAISLQFNIDDDVTDNDDSWKGRLVFEPYYILYRDGTHGPVADLGPDDPGSMVGDWGSH